MRLSGNAPRLALRPLRLAASALTIGAVLSAAQAADAQEPKAQPPGPARSSAQFTLRREEAGGPDGQTARARARAGDCAGALPAFDAALRMTVEPSLRRDRGICHEQLGNPFPAMDDYRAYLTARSDAPDADQIRQRLAALEGRTGSGARTAASLHDQDPEGGHGEGRSASVSMSNGGGAASTKRSATRDREMGVQLGDAQNYDYYVKQEKLADDAEASPLRNGSGFVLGPFVQLPRFFFGDGTAPGRLAYSVGGAFRYSTGSTLTILSELGYGGIGTSGAQSSKAGPVLMGGVELRFPVSRFAGDQLLLRGGVGFERYVVSGTRAVSNNVLGRFAFGYRHVFGPSLGLELLADGGPVVVMPESGDTRVNFALGLATAVVVGF